MDAGTGTLVRATRAVALVLASGGTSACSAARTWVLELQHAVLSREAPRYQADRRLLGTALLGEEDQPIGTVEDVLVEEATGQAQVIFVRPEKPGEIRVYSWSALVFEPEGSLRLCASPSDEGVSGAAYRELFEGQKPSSVQGVLQEKEELGTGLARSLVLKLRDDQNLLHRVLIEPALLVEKRLPVLEAGLRLRFEGLETRDGTGKLWVASAFGTDGPLLELRDASGRIRWSNLAQSARALLGTSIHTADGAAVPVGGWFLDRTSGVLSHLRVEIEADLHALPWTEVQRDVGGGRKTNLKTEELLLMPSVPDGGRV